MSRDKWAWHLAGGTAAMSIFMEQSMEQFGAIEGGSAKVAVQAPLGSGMGWCVG